MRDGLGAAFASVLMLATMSSAQADIADDCEQSDDWTLKRDGCTAVIESGRWVGEDLSWAYNNRGLALFELGMVAESIGDLDQAIRLNPSNPTSYNNRGRAYNELDETERAIADYNAAIRLNPDYALAYYNRGLAYSALGDYEQEVRDYSEAIRIDPGDAATFNNRGAARIDLGLTEDALLDFNEAIRLNPDYVLAHENRAYAHCSLGSSDAAFSDFLTWVALGDRGYTLQERLSDRGFYQGAITGTFDADAKAALRDFVNAGCPR